MDLKTDTIELTHRLWPWLVYGSLFFTLLFGNGLNVQLSHAEEPPEWYRIRTNSVPYQPQDVIVDAAGGLWVTDFDTLQATGAEYEAGVWYHASGAAAGTFEYFSGDRRDNYLAPGVSILTEKPELDASVLYAIRDNQANTWYALRNRTVRCEKANGDWLTFNMQNTDYLGDDATNVDSVHRIRLNDEQSGPGQAKLLISARGIVHLDSNMNVVQTREVYDRSNIYFINDALIDNQGRLWVASNQGLQKGTTLIDSVWIDDDENPSAPPLNLPIIQMEEDALGNIWIITNASATYGIYCYTVGGEWNKYNLSALPASNQIFAVAVYGGSVWFTNNGGLLRYDPNYDPDTSDGPWFRYKGIDDLGLKSDSIISLAPTDAGLWCVTGYNSAIHGNGTGVHYLTLGPTGHPQVTASYAYREQSTSLTSNRINAVAADKSGGVWFPAYDDPSVARLLADGTWLHYRGTEGNQILGDSSVVAVGVDSTNRVYLAPQGRLPVAYDITTEQWMALPEPPFTEEYGQYYYGLHIDADDGKWFCGSFGVYYLNPGNTTWTRFRSEEIPQINDNYVNAALVDDAGNAWFMTRTGLTLMKRDPTGGDPEWLLFTRSNDTGFTSDYRVVMDDDGQVWSVPQKQRFDSENNQWLEAPDDTSAYDHRHLRFLNGRIPVDMDMSGALPFASIADQNLMTLDTRGNIYFVEDYFPVNGGVVVRSPIKGDIDRNGLVQLADAIESARILTGMSSPAQSYTVDVNADGQIGLSETLYILQDLAEWR